MAKFTNNKHGDVYVTTEEAAEIIDAYVQAQKAMADHVGIDYDTWCGFAAYINEQFIALNRPIRVDQLEMINAINQVYGYSNNELRLSNDGSYHAEEYEGIPDTKSPRKEMMRMSRFRWLGIKRHTLDGIKRRAKSLYQSFVPRLVEQNQVETKDKNLKSTLHDIMVVK